MTITLLKSFPLIALSCVFANLPFYQLSVIAQPIATLRTPLQTATLAFNPPPNPRRRPDSKRTNTGIRRKNSCVGEPVVPFTLLSPIETVGYSASTQPVVSWYLPETNQSYRVKLQLFTLDQNGKENLQQINLAYQSGIMSHALPTEDVTLVPGTVYRWQVVVVCNENRPSQSMARDAWFEIVTPSTAAQQRIDAATTAAERALAYGNESLWYDAISQVALANDHESITARHQLLRGLVTYVSTVEIDSEENLSQYILNIIAADTPAVP